MKCLLFLILPLFLAVNTSTGSFLPVLVTNVPVSATDEIPDQRILGLWQDIESPHMGTRFYQEKDGRIFMQNYWYNEDVKGFLPGDESVQIRLAEIERSNHKVLIMSIIEDTEKERYSIGTIYFAPGGLMGLRVMSSEFEELYDNRYGNKFPSVRRPAFEAESERFDFDDIRHLNEFIAAHIDDPEFYLEMDPDLSVKRERLIDFEAP